MTRNEIRTSADKESLAGQNPEVSGLASELLAGERSSAQTGNLAPSREFHGMPVAAVDEMIKGWEKHEVGDPSNSRWPAIDQAVDDFVTKWVEIPFNCLCAVAALPLAGILVAAIAPILIGLGGAEWLFHKVFGSPSQRNRTLNENRPRHKQPVAAAEPPPAIPRQDDLPDRMAGMKERESRLAQAKALVDRATRILANSRSQKALPDKGTRKR